MGERFSSKNNFMRNDVQAAVTVCGKRKARLNVVGGEVGKVVQHLRNSHAATEVIEHIDHGDARMQGLPLRMRESIVVRSR